MSRLSITLVGGFSGSGKTSAVHHFISEHATAPVAVFVENPGGAGIDAKAIRGLCGAMSRSKDMVLEIPDSEEPEQVAWLGAKMAEVRAAGIRRAIVETAGTSNPAWMGRHFGLLPGHAEELREVAALERVVCQVDALDFHRSIVAPGRGSAVRTVFDLYRTQIESATLLVLNKCDLVSATERTACLEQLAAMNAHAFLLETAYGEMPFEIWAMADTPEQLALAVEAGELAPNVSAERDRSALSLATKTFRAHRPFHPQRFWDWFEAEQTGLWRVKGLVWLATRNLLVGGVSRTRRQSSCGVAGIWWAALPREEWPTEIAALEEMQTTWREPWGDRRQEIELLGEARALPGIVRGLSACLLNDEEFGRPVSEWRALADPFPAWDME